MQHVAPAKAYQLHQWPQLWPHLRPAQQHIAQPGVTRRKPGFAAMGNHLWEHSLHAMVLALWFQTTVKMKCTKRVGTTQ